MPVEAFADLWQTLQTSRSWMGIVKNRCKNGDHYWVSAFATPVSRDGKVVEYQSVRTRAQPEQIRAAEALYAALRDGRGARTLRCTMGLRERMALLAAGAGAFGVALGSLLGSAPALPQWPGWRRVRPPPRLRRSPWRRCRAWPGRRGEWGTTRSAS